MTSLNQRLFLGLVLLAGAAPAAVAAPPAPSAAVAPSAAPLTARELGRLAAPEPAAPASEYRVRNVTLRLLGTQGEGALASATLSDTATWATRTYRLDETVGRGLRIAAVTADAVELLDTVAGTRRTVKAGEDFRVRLIEHIFDTAATPHGEHQWSVRAAAMAQLQARYGVGASASEVMLNGVWLVRLDGVQPTGVLGRLGFQDGDLLATVGGEPARLGSPAALAAAVTRASSQVVLVTLLRNGTRFEVAYAIE